MMKKSNLRIAIYVSNPKGAYSGGRYHGLMIAEALAVACEEVFYVTNQIPIFWDDFNSYDNHEKIKVIGGWQNSLTELPPSMDFIFVVPGTSDEEFYDAALGAAMKTNARLVLVNFESGNWFNEYAPVKKPNSKWDLWNRIASASSVILSSAAESTKYAKSYYTIVPKNCLFEECYPAINTFAADLVQGISREKRLVLLTRFSGDAHKGGDHISSIIGPYMHGYKLSILIGNGDVPVQTKNEIEEACTLQGVTIEWLHKLTDIEKFELYKKSEYLLFPSFFEGYGYPPIEARYCGCKVIAFDLPVLRETCGEDAIFAKHGSIEDFKQKLQQALEGSTSLTGFKLEETAPLSAMTARLMKILSSAMGHTPDFDLSLTQYGRPKSLLVSPPLFGIFENKIISLCRLLRRLLKRSRGKITYFPMFGDVTELTSHYHRAAWYFPFKKGLIDSVSLFVTDSKIKPSKNAPSGMQTLNAKKHCHLKIASSRWNYFRNLILSDAVMLWDGQCSSKWLKLCRTLGIPIVNVDTRDVGAKEYGDYPGTIWRHLMTKEEREGVIQASYRNFNSLAQRIRKAGFNKAAVFGTGPSLEKAGEYSFTDTLVIICNSIVQNQDLMEHLRPLVVTAGDAVSHFGVSEYAARFRKDLVQALTQYDLYYFGTATFGYLMSLHYPELEEKFIFIEQGHDGPNFDLLENFSAPKLDSTMNIHMLPLAATFANDIYILGCDGKSPSKDNEDFWAHAKGAQYHDLVDSGHQCHPVFDIHRRKATYNRHVDSVRSTLELGETEQGKRYTSLRKSYIPAFAERNLDADWYLTNTNGEKPLALSSIAEKLGPLVKGDSEKVSEGLSETMLSISQVECRDQIVSIKGWFLSPFRKSRVLLEFDDGTETYLIRKTKRPDIAKKFPEYEQAYAGIEHQQLCDSRVTSVTVSVLHNTEKLKSINLKIKR